MENILNKILKKMPDSLIEEEKILSENDKYWISIEWWNIKHYQFNKNNNCGFEKQEGKRGEHEMPYERNLFYPDDKRFSLKNNPVAYFASSVVICYCETIPELRNNDNLTWKDNVCPYLNNQKKYNEKYFGYSIPFFLKQDVVLINLSSKNSMINFIEENGIKDFYKNIILSRNAETYSVTQILAKYAYDKKIDGIIYKSVRSPNDMNIINDNLVLFRNKLIKNSS